MKKTIIKPLISLVVTGILILSIVKFADPCTIVVVGKDASADGSVIVSHTDCGADCRIRVVHGRNYKQGDMAPVFWGIQDVKRPLDDYGEVIGHIPQVEQTYTYFHSAYPHINEYQLAIGESTMSQRDELKIKREDSKQIITIEQAQAFALQRCKTAREALELITSLLDKYGFLPSCIGESEALCIADVNEVWILEVFSVGPGWDPDSGKPGAIWAAQRVPDDHALVLANWSIIKEIDIKDSANFRASSNYMQAAVDHGWYDPDSGKPFVWQDIYAPLPREWATGRLWLFYSTHAPNYADWPDRSLDKDFMNGYNSYYQYVEPLSLYPFSVKPEKKISLQDVMAFQRSVFEGTIYDKTADLDWFVPDGKGGMKKSPLTTPFPTRDWRELLDIVNRRNVARPHGIYGMIAQLRGWLPDPVGGIYWVFLDNAYTSPYVPIYAGTQKIADCYKTYDPDKYDEGSAMWAVDFVDNLLYLKWQEAIKDVWAVRDPFEKELFDRQPEIDKKAQELYKKSPDLAKEYLTDYTNRKMDEVLEMYVKLRNEMIVKYSNSH